MRTPSKIRETIPVAAIAIRPSKCQMEMFRGFIEQSSL